MLLATYVGLWGWLISLAQHRRRRLFQGLTCTFMLLVILGILELPALLKLVHWRLLMQQATGDVQHLTWAYRLDRELGFRRRPYDRWVGRPTSDVEFRWMMPPSLQESLVFTYDQWGYRNPVGLEKADAILIGDSYVEGWYVSDDQTVSRRLQIHLERPVANLGVAGYGPMQELRVLKRDGLRYQPKTVIWFFFEGNDLYDDHGFDNTLLAAPPSPEEMRAHPQGLTRHHGWRQRSFSLALLPQLRRWSTPILPSRAPYFGRLSQPGQDTRIVYFANYLGKPWTDWEARRWDKTQQTLFEAVEFCRQQGLHVLFVFVPIKFRVYQPFVQFDADSPCRIWRVRPLHQLFDDFCRASGAFCLDLTPFFQQAIRHGKMPYADVDTHWSPEGHDLVAERLAIELRQRHWLDSIEPSR
jgi:hypothetical protein